MADMREDVALAGNPTNLWTERRVRDQDVKLGALGKADALGSALWRLKYKGDARVARKAIVLMAARLSDDHRWNRALCGRTKARGSRGSAGAAPKVTATVLERLAYRVIFEWVNDRCTTCHGRGSTGVMGSMALCSSCSGSGKQPPQHLTRAADLGVTRDQYHRHWEWVIEHLLGQLAQIDEDVKHVLKSEIAVATLPPSVEAKVAA